jgi:hypothetical protein
MIDRPEWRKHVESRRSEQVGQPRLGAPHSLAHRETSAAAPRFVGREREKVVLRASRNQSLWLILWG